MNNLITLRLLANSKKNEFSLEEWIELAKNAGVSTEPDAEIDGEAFLKLRDYVSKYTQLQQAEKEKMAKKEAASARSMEKLIKENYIFIDLSSLLVPSTEKAFHRIAPLLVNSSKKINISKSVLNELKKIAKDTSDIEKAELAIHHYNLLGELYKKNLLVIRDSNHESENNYTKDLIMSCSHFRMQQSLLVITQNEDLARDLMLINEQRSANGKTITVKKINKYGYLSNTIDKPKSSKPFQICSVLRSGEDKKIPVSMIPKENDIVYTSSECKGAISLLKEIGNGGEGTIYKTNTPYVAKIYSKDCCTEYRFEKITKMINAKLEYEGICFPIGILYNCYGQPIGYLMLEAKGISVQNGIFGKRKLLKAFPNWKKEDLVQCAITIVSQIKYVHDNNILIGDINPNNFLVKSPTEVYLVDTDSFQIDDLPCPVGFPLFTPPEIHIQKKRGVFQEYSEILRTKENEYFAVATLIFQLLMPGKPPYTQQGGEDLVDNILEMHFPYAVGERHSENVPDGTWRFIWSHLTKRMKENFFRVFNKEETNSEFNIAERLSVDEWRAELLRYSNIIKKWKTELEKNPLTLDVDPLSFELYPYRLKRRPGAIYVKCKGKDCIKEYEMDSPALKAGYCPECQRKGTIVKCWYDDKEFIFTNYEKYYKKMNTPILCPDCRKDNSVIYKKQCAISGCRNHIEYTKGEAAYAKWKASEGKYTFEYPKICKKCKDSGKKLNQNSSSTIGNKDSFSKMSFSDWLNKLVHS